MWYEELGIMVIHCNGRQNQSQLPEALKTRSKQRLIPIRVWRKSLKEQLARFMRRLSIKFTCYPSLVLAVTTWSACGEQTGGKLNSIMIRVSNWNDPHILRYKQLSLFGKLALSLVYVLSIALSSDKKKRKIQIKISLTFTFST